MHRLSLTLAFYDKLDFFAFFSPKFDDVIIIGFCSYAIPIVPLVIPTHYKKIRLILNNFQALNASQMTNFRFFTHNEITQDFAKLQSSVRSPYEVLTFLKISSL